MINKHTPGPWMASCGTHEATIVMVKDGGSFHQVARTICQSEKAGISEEETANAQLIEAAPELLEALQSVRMHKCMFDDDEEFYAACYKVRDAIKKATGS